MVMSLAMTACASQQDRLELRNCRPRMDGLPQALGQAIHSEDRLLTMTYMDLLNRTDWAALQPGIRCPY